MHAAHLVMGCLQQSQGDLGEAGEGDQHAQDEDDKHQAENQSDVTAKENT